MRYAELHDLSDEQLVHKGLQLEREMMGARFRLYTQQLEDTASIKRIRRYIARVQTAVRGRESEQGLRKNALRDRFASSFTAEQAAPAEESTGFLSGIVDKMKGSE